MKRVLSEKMIVSGSLSVFQAMEFTTVAKQFSSHITLYQNGKTGNAKNLAHVVSYFLTLDPKKDVLVIAEGDDAQEGLKTLKPIVSDRKLVTVF